MKYISKPNEWFDEGTEATLVTEIWDKGRCIDCGKGRTAIFAGIRHGKPDEEMCCLCEFEEIED